MTAYLIRVPDEQIDNVQIVQSAGATDSFVVVPESLTFQVSEVL